MYHVLFVDPVCPRPYDGLTLQTLPQGGTESSVTRVAEALAARGHQVAVAQHNRPCRAKVNQVDYALLGTRQAFRPTHVVVLRDTSLLDELSRQWPGARQYVWYTDFPEAGETFDRDAAAHVRNRATVITLSQWHRQAWERMYAGRHGDPVEVERIYLPIPDDLEPNDTPVDPDKFVYFSSPHKGLRDTVRLFSRLGDYPGLNGVRLHVANPGYRVNGVGPADGRVVDLGPLPWNRVIREVRSAFLVLHYNRVYPETFGLVHAEANAVGTPWISGPLGANPEVCAHPDEMVDVEDPCAVIERILRWRSAGRPTVRGNAAFRISRIVAEWEAMFARA